MQTSSQYFVPALPEFAFGVEGFKKHPAILEEL